MIELLLQNGAAIAGSGAMHLAGKMGHIEALDFLLDHGADLNEIPTRTWINAETPRSEPHCMPP
jgi:hypothetical protein